MSVNVQNNERLNKISQLRAKLKQYGEACNTISEILKQRGINIEGIANMGLSQEEIILIANYFTFKNEQINISCDLSQLNNLENDAETRNREINQLEADRQISERKKQEELYRQQKQEENKIATEKSYFENNKIDIDYDR